MPVRRRPVSTYTLTSHDQRYAARVWHFVEGEVEHVLDAGDCLELGPPSTCTFRNPTAEPCRYLVAIAQRNR